MKKYLDLEIETGYDEEVGYLLKVVVKHQEYFGTKFLFGTPDFVTDNGDVRLASDDPFEIARDSKRITIYLPGSKRSLDQNSVSPPIAFGSYSKMLAARNRILMACMAYNEHANYVNDKLKTKQEVPF